MCGEEKERGHCALFRSGIYFTPQMLSQNNNFGSIVKIWKVDFELQILYYLIILISIMYFWFGFHN